MAKNGRKIAAGVGAVSTLAVSGAALASSQTVSTGTSTPNITTQQGSAAGQDGHGMRGMHDKLVTGTAATNVKNAVKAKDASITVKGVRQAPDGSYRAFGTKAGKRVMVEVRKDLKTVTVRTGMGPGGHGGPGEHGHHRGTEVTGTALTDVKNAVKAKDSGVTVEKVYKESDGTYRAFGTKAGAHVRIDVSKDLKTVTVTAGKPGGPGGHDGPRHDGAPSGQTQGGSGSTSSSTTAPTSSSTSAQAA
ncbi:MULTISPECIES: hypothetical protein [Dermacoccus]|uniref:hypothetical protein n=1 Tax=Dermacoccus TaxID=57495 RepID=UPI000A58FE86|nr:hypothetical protein [Dermacoccus nishinomiyaensis]